MDVLSLVEEGNMEQDSYTWHNDLCWNKDEMEVRECEAVKNSLIWPKRESG